MSSFVLVAVHHLNDLVYCICTKTSTDNFRQPGCAVLVDCLTLWLSNLIAAGRDIDRETAALADALPALPGPVVLVSNEVGQGIVPDNPLARRFRDHAGLMHQAVAAVVPAVIFMVAGMPVAVKRPPRTE